MEVDVSGPVTTVPRLEERPPVAHGAGMTHRGLVRGQNEDSILTDPSGTLWAVADGMGGYGHGDLASEMVIDQLEAVGDDGPAMESLVTVITRANRAVYERARADGFGQMGSTVVAMMIQHAFAYIAWVGDSRAYLLRNGRLRMLTRDHTVVQIMVDRGELTLAEAEGHPESHIVTRAVGGDDDILVDTVSLPLLPGDRLMLCSDGLPRAVFEPVIESSLRATSTPETACQALVREALDNGAPDNVSVIVVDLIEG